ncbi:site-specific integrase [Streptomyces rochei]|uniref:site-specific integrase n=1 Tax=Streptomyces TaxID=1883 RepID=UPI0021AF32DA|nr:site-specific integrase [Streptomyces sp. WAC02707]
MAGRHRGPFYNFHLDESTGSLLVNPFPLVRGRRLSQLGTQRDGGKKHRNRRTGLYRPTVPQRVPQRIPDEMYTKVFAGLRSHRDRALLAFWVATGARAEVLLTVKQGGAVIGEQTVSVIRKGTRRSFTGEERSAFWVWAAIEILRHTGIHIEELLELGHHSIVSYKLPTTGQTVPFLQIAPSKTDQERLVLVTPELADVLSTVVSRVRGSDGRVPVLRSYDHYERVWNPPMPLLFQDRSGGYLRPLSRATIRRALDVTMLASGLTDSAGDPLVFQPHDFRRIFITDSILNGLPPHIAQVIAGHDHIGTTMGYAATYPTDAIEAHRAFIARRRALRPADEYRTVTPEEWGEFLGHFERRKLALGDCGRAYGTDCAHEHACVRCPVLIVHATERPRLVEIRDNLLTRILEAERESWLGEIEGLQSSLAHAEEKLAQLDAQISRKQESVDLGIPTFREIAARTSGVATPPGPA